MNGLAADLDELKALAAQAKAADKALPEILICVPATLISRAAEICLGTPIRIGAQDCHTAEAGAYTGDISAPMLRDAGASAAIVGHSERRTMHKETDADVRNKAIAALAAGLLPIVCVGETETERRNGTALKVVHDQIAASLPDLGDDQPLALAYEPVWAIGTGLVPTDTDITEMHGAIRTQLVKRLGERGGIIPILYGGSMKPDNAASILAIKNVDGGLVGGASLKAIDFGRIIDAAP